MRQKAVTLTRINRQLEMMNCKLPDVVSDIEGVGAMKIINAIASGETDSEKPVNFLNLNLFKASKEDLEESLKGNYRPCLVNVLKEKLVEYDFFVSQMRKYEQYIISILEHISQLEEQKRMVKEKMEQTEQTEQKAVKKKTDKKPAKARKNEYSFDGSQFLRRILGTDLTEIEGFSDKTLLTILSYGHRYESLEKCASICSMAAPVSASREKCK